MGKAVPRNVKSRAGILLEEQPGLFSDNYEKNKEAVKALGLPVTKKIRNLITGFITRKKKQEKTKPENK